MTRNRKTFSAAMPLGALLLLGACASVPDAANPAHWYRSTVDYFSGDDAEAEKKKQEAERQKQRQARAQAPAPTQAAPSQAAPAQPARGPETSDVVERSARPAGRGLLADTGAGQPRYAAAIPRQTEDPGTPASRAAAAPTAMTTAAAEPPPTPAPRAPVSAAAPSTPQPAAAPPSRPAPEIAQAPPLRPPAQAAQPPAAVSAPPPPPARSASVEETYRASLVQQTQLPSAGAAGLPDDPGTVIISSEGIEAPRRAARPDRGASSVARGDSPARPTAAASAAGVGRSFLGTALKPAGTVEGLAEPRATKVATIQFADGSARLDGEARQILGQVAKLQSEKGGTVRVIGHASMRTKPMDADRHVKVNEGISIARANAVAGQLARLGVKREAIVVSARGDADPAYYEVMETGEAGNRRTEIYLDF